MQAGCQPARLQFNIGERAGEGPHSRVHPEAGIGVVRQAAGDEIAERVSCPPPSSS
jgi:hypothetical protein